MAYMNQERKKELAPGIKEVLTLASSKAPVPYGAFNPGAFRVNNHIELIVTLTEGILDFGTLERHVSTNPYNIKNHYKGIAQKFLLELLDAMQGTIYYDRSDIQTDYFDVAYYISIHIGKWDKPYILHTYVNKIQDELNGVINNE